jgi:hypothetical protein
VDFVDLKAEEMVDFDNQAAHGVGKQTQPTNQANK